MFIFLNKTQLMSWKLLLLIQNNEEFKNDLYNFRHYKDSLIIENFKISA